MTFMLNGRAADRMTALLMLLICGYRRWLSPLMPPSCRFQPTCSAYALEALARHGLWRGGLLSLRRLSRCHPWGGCGFDPVPPLKGSAG